MSHYDAYPRRRFYRNRDKAMVAGVCAGLADYFGFNLRVTRFLAFISLLMAMPITLLFYFGMVVLFPSAPDPAAQPRLRALHRYSGSNSAALWPDAATRA